MDHFTSRKARLTSQLTQFLNNQHHLLHEYEFAETVFTQLQTYCVRGKMLRGSMVINTALELGGNMREADAEWAAMALELVGSALLIHDDIIDRDQYRRGQETIHRQFSHQYQTHDANSMAICVGDLVFFLSYQALGQVTGRNQSRLQRLFSLELSRVVFGQMKDVSLAVGKERATKSDIFEMYQAKTSRYTFCLPLLAGAMIADQDDQFMQQLDEIGKIMGVIFQITDDRLGLFGDQLQTGKAVGADIAEGKKTLYTLYFLDRANKLDKERFDQLFGLGSISVEEADEVQQLLLKYNIQELVETEQQALTTQVSERIMALAAPDSFKAMLSELTNYIYHRSK